MSSCKSESWSSENKQQKSKQRARIPERNKSEHRENSMSNENMISCTYYNGFYDKKRSIRCTDIEGNETIVEFIYQFVKKSYSYQNDSIDYCSEFYTNIIGPPEGHLDYEYIRKTFRYHLILSLSPIQYYTDDNYHDFSIMDPTIMDKISINIEYHVAVYPIRITIYDTTYNLEDAIQIWAQDPDNQWFLLGYHSLSKHSLRGKMLLSITLHPCNFKTKLLRLVFNHRLEEHKLDAIMLIGTSELILSKNPEKQENLKFLIKGFQHCGDITEYNVNSMRSISTHPTDMLTCVHEDILDLIENFHKYGTICKRNIVQSFHKNQLGHKQISYNAFLGYIQIHKQSLTVKDYSNYNKFIEDLKFLWDKSKKSYDSFSKLPDETILNILKDLDLRSLCRVSRVNKRLNHLTRDPFLYTSLNMRNIHFTYWRTNLWHKFNYFARRCKYLKELDLSYCDIPVVKFNVFIHTCGKRLTHLNLSRCRCVNNSVLRQISKTCPNLKELNLSCCRFVNDKGFSYLENLKYLECLNLQTVEKIKTKTLCKILQKNQQLRDLNLANTRLNIYEVIVELKNLCPNLETINLQGTRITSYCIYALANCKNVREIYFSLLSITLDITNEEILKEIFHKLFSSLRLEKLDITDYNVNQIILDSLKLCENLKSFTFNGHTEKFDSNIFF
ncbi:uncharacterized protein LOC118647567 isoform X2 [Monomorium pharaonis]|uniref:uncharacterized protein LOC118647567 isoform X2 n=1 Tax=Monomorium pharaonis TaxID=307658 RepID=UPI00174715E6|nr:uncharacterized protein LOC118647567 isoform X2 [Monomorium pharaonis]